MNAHPIPLLLIVAAVVTSLGVAFVPGLQPPTWHGAVTAVEPFPSARLAALLPPSVAEAGLGVGGLRSGPIASR
ncbi:MAG: hypothetical protein COW73_04250 [Nitrospirae bacterium CG18_big_fil_WC_8_21_14_2_50_70_55]|nr:hypothetical protein [Deltaproteobacteria bacterium]OIP66937.1 MAG: hypothetical protein AUK30_01430 [Nitrospirae bacterium CG2_30_70_394]PIQ05993.1 MAG: hypothetical protein COW73_04250 [Nitrospirae bacterium CG18_big_fil_WC_8_21_14_2_50_70_55]PIU78514.1 MAG: hypothetical protein COS73_06915 [Nitrospirae bacterium CG06_land_8_20_14_3_00_70_43]PIW83700.1 MAG: hypothetical protein COZ96_02020 [Nitrospirae bacterium CG_4_8_14_3_um_filter_70_85]PIX83391.1 MAG: hypothetical protein COZ33_05690 